MNILSLDRRRSTKHQIDLYYLEKRCVPTKLILDADALVQLRALIDHELESR
jgi:hypothetical protein